MATSSGRVPMLDDNGRFPDRFAPPSVAADAAAATQAKLDAQQARTEAQGIADGVSAQAIAAVKAEVVAQVDPKVIAAQSAQTGAVSAKDAAVVAKTAAEAAKAAAEAVGATNDTIMAAKIQDPASATAGALNAAIGAQVTAVIVPAASVIPSGYRTVLMGDSITAYNGGLSTATPVQATALSYSSTGMHRWANVMLGQWLNIIGNSGIGGNEANQIRARFATDVLAYKPDIVTILAGSNDEPEDPTIVDLEAMYKLALDAGITVLAHTIPPTVTGVSGIETHRLAVNDWIRDYVNKTPGMILADIGPAWQDTTKPGYVANPKFLADGVHPNTLGAQVAGAIIAKALRLRLAEPLKETIAAFAPFNLLSNPRFNGTGTAIPTGWALSAGSATFSYLPNPTGPGQQLVVTVPAGGNASFTADASVTGTDVRVGDSVEFSVGFRCWDLEVTTTNIQRLSTRIQQWNGTTFHATASDVYIDGGAQYGNARYPMAQGAFRTPKSTIIAGTTIAQVSISMNGGGVYVLNEPTLKNLTGIATGRIAGA